MELAGADLISRARAGDGEAFRALTEPHRRELQVHCYRMLGSFQDAEDALQDSLLSAWRGLDGFDGRASIRTWLYRIATNRCLSALRSAIRRPAREWEVPGVEPPDPTRLGEIVWLEPYPDALLEGAVSLPLGPEARYEQAESVSLAFVTALQVLPPRQLAVLILRDVLGFHADETAGMLDTTVESVKSALRRARAGLQQRRLTAAAPEPPTPSRARRRLVRRGCDRGGIRPRVGVRRHRRPGRPADGRRLHVHAALPLEYEGLDVVTRFCDLLFGAGRRFDLIPTRANGQPAFGVYLRAPSGIRHGTGLYVLTLDTTLSIGEVSALTGLTTHTLRFYEQEGLFFAPVRRNAAGRRVFTEAEVQWLKVCTKLRSSGMPLPEIRRYAQLLLEGTGNEAERFEVLRRHEARVQQQVADLQEALGIIHAKVEIYARHLAAGTADDLWRNGPECDPVPHAE